MRGLFFRTRLTVTEDDNQPRKPEPQASLVSDCYHCLPLWRWRDLRTTPGRCAEVGFENLYVDRCRREFSETSIGIAAVIDCDFVNARSTGVIGPWFES